MRTLLPVSIVLCLPLAAAAQTVHLWEKQEITFTASRDFANPYTEVTVWIDLTGPGFSKRVYGFWDGGRTFRVRVVATALGEWRWRSGSQPADSGLTGKTGTFNAIGWTEAEKQANPLRHGFLRATANGHALEHADGAPFFAIGDTWWALGTNRFRWQDGPEPSDRAHGRFPGLRTAAEVPGLQLGEHDRRLPQLEQRRAALAHHHERC